MKGEHEQLFFFLHQGLYSALFSFGKHFLLYNLFVLKEKFANQFYVILFELLLKSTQAGIKAARMHSNAIKSSYKVISLCCSSLI